MLENVKPKAKKAWENFKKYGLKFLKIAFDEIIIFAKDFWSACKFVYKTRNENQCWEAAKRNWWKFAKYFGAFFVFFGLNLSLGTIGFVLGSLIVSKVLGVILPWLCNRVKKEKVCGISWKKVCVCLAVGKILLPVIAILSFVAHWWLLLLGSIMALFGCLADFKRRRQAQKQSMSEQDISQENSDKNNEEAGKKDENKNKNKNENDALLNKENQNNFLKKLENMVDFGFTFILLKEYLEENIEVPFMSNQNNEKTK